MVDRARHDCGLRADRRDLGGPRTGLAAAAEEDEIRDNLRQFSKVLSLVEREYAGDVDAEKAVFNGAIPSMLQRLDPHSQFFSPESFKQLRDEQKGQYAGVGMQIQYRNGRTVVMFPFPKTPAYKVGLRPGDIIAEVNGESTEGLNTTEVAKRLRGPAGTKVRIGIERRGVEDLIEVEVTRARIPRRQRPGGLFPRAAGRFRANRYIQRKDWSRAQCGAKETRRKRARRSDS